MRWLLLLLVLPFAACGGDEGDEVTPSSSALPTEDPRAILVLAIDGLRLDDVGPDLGRIAPNLAALRQRSIRAREAIAPSTALNPSLASWLTGLPSEETGVGSIRTRGRTALAPQHSTVPERYNENGWRTVGVVSQVQLRPEISGLNQGFAVYEAPVIATNSTFDAEQGALLLQPYLAEVNVEGSQPLFALWSIGDLMNEGGSATADAIPTLAHHLATYMDQIPRVRAVLDGGTIDPAAAVSEIESLLGRSRGSKAFLAMRRGLREGRLAYIDRQIGQVLDALPDESMVVLLSPRGSWLAPPTEARGPAFNPDLVRVPLWVSLPDGAWAAAQDNLIGIRDVFPALTAFAGEAESGWAQVVSAIEGARGQSIYAVRDARLERFAVFDADGQLEHPDTFDARMFDRDGVLQVVEAEDLRRVRMAGELAAVRRPSVQRLHVKLGAAPADVRWVFGDGGFARTEWVRTDRSEGSLRGVSGATVIGPGLPLTHLCRRPAMPMRLDLEAEGMTEAGVLVGETLLTNVPIPRLSPPGDLDPKPEGAVVSFSPDGVWRFLKIDAKPEQEVQVILMLHPPKYREETELDWNGGYGYEVELMAGRDDAILGEGKGPLEMRVREMPSREWALAVMIDGQVIPAEQIDAGETAWGRAGAISLSVPDWMPGVTEHLAPPLEGDPPPHQWHVWRGDAFSYQGPGQGLDAHTRAHLQRLPASE
jgi:hypothetical protein